MSAPRFDPGSPDLEPNTLTTPPKDLQKQIRPRNRVKFVTGDSGCADHLRSLLPGFDGYADDLRKFVTGESGYADHLRTLLPGFHGYADDLRKFVTDGYILLYKGVTVFRWVVLGRRALGFYRGVGGVGLLHTAVTAPR